MLLVILSKGTSSIGVIKNAACGGGDSNKRQVKLR